MGTIRIGIIGAGGISKGHGKRFVAHPDVELVALAEPSEVSLGRFRKAVLTGSNVPEPTVYADHRDMLEKENLDGVLVASPHTLHHPQIMDALSAGVAVLTEKPLACSAKETNEIIQKSKQTSVPVVVSYQRRFGGLYRFIKRFIHNPAFGRVNYVSSFLSQEWLQSQQGTWRQNPKLSGGGQLNDSGSHIVDMLMWVLDEPLSQVSAMIDNRGRDVDIDSAINFRTQSGILGTVSIIGSGPNGMFWEDMTITGEHGQALFLRNGKLQVSMGHGLEVMTVNKFQADESPTTHFLDVIQGKTSNQSPPEEFLRVIEFTEACWKSADQGGAPINF